MSERLELGVDVAAPSATVWAALVDWDRQGEWMLGTRVRGGSGVGASVEAWTGLGPVGFLDTMRITEWEPPRRCAVVHTGRVVRGTGLFAVEPLASGGSRVVWVEDVELPLSGLGRAGWLLGRAGWALVRPALRAGVALSLRRFARQVEAGSVGQSR